MRKSIYLTIALIAVLAVSGITNFMLLAPDHASSTNRGGGGVTATLAINVFDQAGHIISSHTIPNDIFTSNYFNNTWAAVESVSDIDRVMYRNGTNTADSWPANNAGSTNYPLPSLGSQANFGSYPAYIEVGNSSTAPTIWDYKLGSQLWSSPVTSAAMSIVGTQINVSVSTAFTITVAANLTEAGMVAYSYYAYRWLSVPIASAYYLVNHDTFTAIPVAIGNVVQVEYTYVFN